MVAVVVAAVVLLVVLTRTGSDKPPTPTTPATTGQSGPRPRFANCDEARAAGRSNIPRGDRDYQASLGKDNDGIACEAGKDQLALW
jgi:excalibur calcium-binding domain-containing protein